MSVLVQSTGGWVLDARALIDGGYTRCTRFQDDRQSRVKCTFKRQCFYMSRSYCGVNIGAAADGGSGRTVQKTEKPAKVKIRSVILEGTEALVNAAQSLGYLKGVRDTAREPLPSQECNLAALCEMAKELPLAGEQEECVQPLAAEDGRTTHVDLFSRVTENATVWASVVTLLGEDYVIPPHTAFLLSDFTRIQPLVHYERRFDLIVMDPPWENKSVKRSRRYSSLPSTQLKRLPIPLLASPNCLVVSWVTNRPSHLRFVRNELYPHWGVEVVAEWFWVKVTTSGQFVFPLDSPHKKPYEVLVLGRYRSSKDDTISSSESSGVPIEDRRLIVSVPSALHSQKPSLSEVLKPYIRAGAKCLELFARSLQPGWTSWGNEVLKFQHTSYFTLSQTDDIGDITKDDGTDRTAVASGLSSPGETSRP
uniref:Uncharacterized protein n=1 Tax=Mola mola TaxID=94237 RepID=A0A3Q3VPC5_MOLML